MCPCTKRTAWDNSFLNYQKSIAFVRSVPCFDYFTNEKRKFVIARPRSGVGMVKIWSDQLQCCLPMYVRGERPFNLTQPPRGVVW